MASRWGTVRRSGRVRAALSGCALSLLVACAGGADKFRDGRFAAPKLAATLSDLAALEPGWEVARAPDATLAYRHADGSRASWLRECRGVEANPKALGRGLWIALPGAQIESGAAREIAGRRAWQHVGRAQDGARGLQIATISRVAPRCEDHWLLVVPHGELYHRGSFEAWAASLAEAAP
jgi:hypothetical protein